MTFGESIIICLKKGYVLKGRASRSEFWFFQLFIFMLSLISTLISSAHPAGALISIFLSIVLIGPQISVAVRRFHDINKSGWNVFWSLAILWGGIFFVNININESVISFLILETGNVLFMIFNFIRVGTKGENRYGENPIFDDESVCS